MSFFSLSADLAFHAERSCQSGRSSQQNAPQRQRVPNARFRIIRCDRRLRILRFIWIDRIRRIRRLHIPTVFQHDVIIFRTDRQRDRIFR